MYLGIIRAKAIIRDLVDLLSVYEPNEDYLKQLLVTDIALEDDELEEIGLRDQLFAPKKPTNELSLEIIQHLESAIEELGVELIELVVENSDIKIVASNGDQVIEVGKYDRLELKIDEERELISYVDANLSCSIYKKNGSAFYPSASFPV